MLLEYGNVMLKNISSTSLDATLFTFTIEGFGFLTSCPRTTILKETF